MGLMLSDPEGPGNEARIGRKVYCNALILVICIAI